MTMFLIPGPLNGIAPVGRALSAFWGGKTVGYQVPSNGWDGVNASSASNVKAAYKLTADRSSMADMEAEMCLNVSGEAFGKLVMGLRDDALGYARARKIELSNWDAVARARVEKWFNASDEATRGKLQQIIDNVIRVLNGLKPSNFIDDTEGNLAATGCVPPVKDNGPANAAVCPPDTEKHRILIGTQFFSRPKYGFTYGTTSFDGRDSQLQTLIHEVTHFDDVASSKDDFYGAKNSVMHSKKSNAITNADSLASYILGMNVTAPDLGSLSR